MSEQKMMMAKKAIRLNNAEGEPSLELKRYARDPNFAFDKKLDGTRMVAKKENGLVTLFGRGSRQTEDGGRTQTIYNEQFPELVAEFELLDLDNFIVDGEVWVMGRNETGQASEDFNLLQKRTTRKHNIAEVAKEYPVKFSIFDAPILEGRDIKGEPFFERRRLLEYIFDQSKEKRQYISVLPLIDTVDEKLGMASRAIAWNYEGLMIKHLEGKYMESASPDWIKAKRTFTEDFFVMGYTPGTGRREQWFGALHCYKWEDGVPVWVTDVGGGFSDIELDYFTRLHKVMDTVSGEDALSRYHWLRNIDRTPVIEIEHYGTMKKGKRHPNFLRIRTDKDPEQCDGKSR